MAVLLQALRPEHHWTELVPALAPLDAGNAMASLAADYGGPTPMVLGATSPSFLMPAQQQSLTLPELTAMPLSSWHKAKGALLAKAKNASAFSRRSGDDLSQLSIRSIGEQPCSCFTMWLQGYYLIKIILFHSFRFTCDFVRMFAYEFSKTKLQAG